MRHVRTIRVTFVPSRRTGYSRHRSVGRDVPCRTNAFPLELIRRDTIPWFIPTTASIPRYDAFALSSVTRDSSVDVNGRPPLPLPVPDASSSFTRKAHLLKRRFTERKDKKRFLSVCSITGITSLITNLFLHQACINSIFLMKSIHQSLLKRRFE